MRKAELWVDLLEADGLTVTTEMRERMAQHADLIGQWNSFAGLVSKRDVSRLWEEHVVDSLSLAPVILPIVGDGQLLLDIGSGAGFPVIPLKIVMPGLRLLLLERSERKVGFLRKAVATLALRGVEVIQASFPEGLRPVKPRVITARAVERPERVVRSILQIVEKDDAVFLCQWSGFSASGVSGKFHVEPVHDRWTVAGLRKGALYLVRRRAAA